MIEVIKLVGIGIVLGVSNVIPGVSGGTMAVVFGIYDKLISVITINVKKIISMWKFWLPLAIGVGIGILGFSTALVALFENYPVPTNWFFIGLIAGSLPLIIGKIKSSSGENVQSPSFSVVAAMLVALAIMVVMDALNNTSFSQLVQTDLTPSLFFFLLASGALAAIAMIIPGISGSFLLLVIGSYTTIITAVSQLNIPILIPVAIGVPLGLLGGAKLVRFLLEKAPAQTYGAILGLIAGSIVVIYPGIQIGVELLISVLTLAVGFSLAYFSSRK